MIDKQSDKLVKLNTHLNFVNTPFIFHFHPQTQTDLKKRLISHDFNSPVIQLTLLSVG